MDKTDILRLKSIVAYCNDMDMLYERFGDDFEHFTSDRAYYYALSMCLYQISELIIRVKTPELKEQISSELPWNEIRAFRNVLAHGYGTVNDRLMWSTAQEDIPKVEELCLQLIAKAENC